MIKLALLLAALALPPAPARYVTDNANVLDDARENALNERLAQYERDTSNQLIVYVDRRIPEGTTLEEMSREALNTWGVGQKAKDNGVILFLFVEDRRSRIEVGYGLEQVLTEERAKRILADLRDDLRAGDSISAAERGVEKIIFRIAQPYAEPIVSAFPTAAPVTPPVERSWPEVLIGHLIPLFVVAGVLAFVVLVLRHGNFEFPELRTSSRDEDDPLHHPAYSPPSPTHPSSFLPSSSPSSSSGSTGFTGGGGNGRGSGASDSW